MLSTCMMAKNCLPTTLCSVEVLYSAMLNNFTNGSQSQGYSELFIAIQNAFYMPNARCLALIDPKVACFFVSILAFVEVLSVHFVADG